MSGRLLVAGIGNVFLGDDGFGVEVVRRLSGLPLPAAVRVVDFGIRGFDLACALVDGYAGAVLVDTAQRGGAPGTLYVIEPALPAADAPPPAGVEGHGLDPVKVLHLAGALGTVCPWLRLVGCEPLTFGTEEEPIMGLSAPVEQAVGEAVLLIGTIISQFLSNNN